MPKSTPAQIPAESAAAHRSEYDPAVPLDTITPHPRNIRHNATADPEMVDSIRENGLLQPLVITPAGAGAYQLVAGHRRLDGLLRAGFSHAPAIIRHDLVDEEADQIAAMLIENGRRADLSPIEEAEGFDLLTELGWDAEQIATASGRSKTLVAARRKLTALPEKAKAAVDNGQVTIDDALRIAKLPAAEQRHLEGMISAGGFKYEISRIEDRVRRAKEVETEAKALRGRKVPELDLPKGIHNEFMLNHADHGMVRLPPTGFPNSSDHDGCLAFVRGGTKQYPTLIEVCTDPGKHDAQLTEVQLARKAEEAAEEAAREQRRQEYAETQRAEGIARQLRCDTILAGKRKPLDATLDLLVRLALPELMRQNPPANSEVFQNLVGVPEEQRWDGVYNEAFDTWADSLADATPAARTTALAAYMLDGVEASIDMLEPDDPGARAGAAAYFAALEAAGHELNPIDIALRDKALATSDDTEEGAA